MNSAILWICYGLTAGMNIVILIVLLRFADVFGLFEKNIKPLIEKLKRYQPFGSEYRLS